MPTVEPAYDLGLIDRARSFADLLRYLFGLLQAYHPKAVADLLNDFDPTANLSPETVGRWLRGERKPSKEHLQLIFRLFQAHGLLGKVLATDAVFARIAAFLGKLPRPGVVAVGAKRVRTRMLPQTSLRWGSTQWLRQNMSLTAALEADMDTPGESFPHLRRSVRGKS